VGKNRAGLTRARPGFQMVSGGPCASPVENVEGDLNGIQLQSLASAAAATEPASLALLGAGALGLAGYGWRQRRRAAA
jgi:hypothetical protein